MDYHKRPLYLKLTEAGGEVLELSSLGGWVCASSAVPFTRTQTHKHIQPFSVCPARPHPVPLPLSDWLSSHKHCCWLRATRGNGGTRGGSTAVTLPHDNPCWCCWRGRINEKIAVPWSGCNDLMTIFKTVVSLHLETSLEINLNLRRKLCSCRLDHVWFQPNVNDVSASAGVRRDGHSCALFSLPWLGFLE